MTPHSNHAINQIQSHCLSLIEERRNQAVITLLRNIVIDQKHFTTCVNLGADVSKHDEEKILLTEYRDNRETQSRSLTYRLIQFVQNLPDDHTIVQQRIEYELTHGKDFSEAFRMVSCCYGIGTVNFARSLNQEIDNFQETELESATGDDDVLKFSEKIDNASQQLREQLEQLEQATDFDGHDIDGFIREFLSNRHFTPNFRRSWTEEEGDISPYFADIQQRPDAVKRHLLLWEEQFLIGNYAKALRHAEAARVDELATTSLNYEYTLLAYLRKEKHDALIAEAVRGKGRQNFDYLLLLISRARQLKQPSSTLTNTLAAIFQELVGGLRKFYHNIDYTYLLDDSERGRSRRREYVKNILQTYLRLVELIPAKDNTDTFPEELLQELDGVRKYAWISVSGGRLGNRTNLEAIDLRRRLLEIVLTRYPDRSLQELYERSFDALQDYGRAEGGLPATVMARRRKHGEALRVLNALYERDASSFPDEPQRNDQDVPLSGRPVAEESLSPVESIRETLFTEPKPAWLREPPPLDPVGNYAIREEGAEAWPVNTAVSADARGDDFSGIRGGCSWGLG